MQIETDLQLQNPIIRHDADAISQCLTNIPVSNAIKYSKDEICIYITRESIEGPAALRCR